MTFYLFSILYTLVFSLCPPASSSCQDSSLLLVLCPEVPPNLFLPCYWPFSSLLNQSEVSLGKTRLHSIQKDHSSTGYFLLVWYGCFHGLIFFFSSFKSTLHLVRKRDLNHVSCAGRKYNILNYPHESKVYI